MIDKVVIVSSVIYLLVFSASSVSTHSSLNDPSSNNQTNSNNPTTSDLPTTITPPGPTAVGGNESHSSPESQSAQLQSLKSSPEARKNKIDASYPFPEDDPERATESSRRNKDRERNTKPPVLRRGKDPEEEFDEEPTFEKRPALLLRFFPDGTAVLISKFQLHLHVKPKQVKFVPEEKEEHFPVDVRPGFFLENDKSYEVSYKRLEAVPWTRDQNVFDLDESEENEAYHEDVRLQDHEFATPETVAAKTSVDETKLHQLLDVPVTTPTSATDQSTDVPTVGNNDQKLDTTVRDFAVTDGPAFPQARAEPLKVTTTTVGSPSMTMTVEETKTTQIPPSSTATAATTTTASTEPTTSTAEAAATTPKCVSFKNQLSLALSTEDNIGNSLLKRNILPTEDCNTSEDSNSIAKLQSLDVTTTTTTTTRPTTTPLPIITRPKAESTTPSYTRNHLVPYLASQYSNDPAKPDVVVVTSLPVLIDLKSNSRSRPVTDVPAWREVTVGVVRDQQGQPMKPRYNNWVSHLRTLRKKTTDNKFWNDLTTPRPGFGPHSRQPIQQGFQQAPSQVNRAFWADLQRQRPLADERGRAGMNPELYRSNPPRNYPVQNKNDFQFWRNGHQGNGWNNNNNVPEYEKKGLLRNPHRNFENQEPQPNQQWNRGNTLKNHRRW